MLDKTLSKIIKEVSDDLADDSRNFKQDFIAFRPKEFQAIMNAEKTVCKKLSIQGKGRVIGLACGVLARVLADDKEKSNEKV